MFAPEQTLLQVSYIQVTNGVLGEKTPAIMCDKYAEKYLANKVGDGELGSFYAELYGMPYQYFCPDFDSASIQGDNATSTSFNILVELTPSYM